MADSKISALTDGTTPATTDASPWARSGGTTVKLTWAELKAATPGAEIGYDQITSPVTVSSTTEASGTTVITCAAHTFDGAPVIAEFFAVITVGATASSFCNVSLFESTTEIGLLGGVFPASIVSPVCMKLRFTPSAGSHTYTVTAYRGVSNATIGAGAGGTATQVPAFVRFTKV